MSKHSGATELQPRVGLFVRDAKNTYKIVEESIESNTHTGKSLRFKVLCISGPNAEKERWISRDTFFCSNHFAISEK